MTEKRRYKSCKFLGGNAARTLTGAASGRAIFLSGMHAESGAPAQDFTREIRLSQVTGQVIFAPLVRMNRGGGLNRKTLLKTIERSGIKIEIETFGSRSDPCLVLIMGATASMLSWPDTLCRRLADAGLYVVRFDHRDTGASTTVPPGEADYCVEDMAGDVISILDGLGIDGAHLMGMSLGGYIAQMLALTHAERLLSLTLVASEPLGWDGDALPHIRPEILDHFSGVMALDWSSQTAIASFLLELERLNAGTGSPFDEEAAQARILQVLSRTQSPASMFNHASLDVREDWSGAYQRIRLPVLVIHGEQDPVLPVENGQALAERIPGSVLVTLEGTGHELPERDHERMVRVVTGHIRNSAP